MNEMSEETKIKIEEQELWDKTYDSCYSRSLFIDGQHIRGCERVQIDVGVNKEDPRTKVICTFVIAKDSLKIDSNRISFDFPWGNKKEEIVNA